MINSQTNNNKLQASGLTCIRDTNILFENLSFEIAEGEVLVVEGQNGSGKSSLLRIISGIRQQDEGTVTWKGENINSLGAAYRQDIAYLGHLDGIKLDLSAIENLQLARIYGKLSGTSPDDALEMTGLSEQADIKASALSAGQKRRLAMARLLLTECSLWILDEPLTALDKAGVTLFEGLLKKHLSGGGIAILSSHHDINLEGSHMKRMELKA